MDKARFPEATLLQYFGLSPKNIPIEDAANQLVQELTVKPPAYGANSSAFSTQVPVFASNAALAALRIMHGEEPEDDHDQGGHIQKKDKGSTGKLFETGWKRRCGKVGN